MTTPAKKENKSPDSKQEKEESLSSKAHHALDYIEEFLIHYQHDRSVFDRLRVYINDISAKLSRAEEEKNLALDRVMEEGKSKFKNALLQTPENTVCERAISERDLQTIIDSEKAR